MYDPKAKYGAPIKGGIANGYNEKELNEYCKDLEGYASYLFNKSHAACYSYISILTAYFKTYYPAKFMASLLTMQESQDKIEQYIKIARSMGIKVSTPDINRSDVSFSENNGEILFGLGSIKGVGETSIPAILENRPYQSLEDAMNKIDKKYFNKKVCTSLIKAGAFDFYNPNRNQLIFDFFTARKEKGDYPDPNAYNDRVCDQMEKEVLSTHVTNIPFWESIPAGENVQLELTINSVFEKTDKNGRLMGFISATTNYCDINAIAFAHVYVKNMNKLVKDTTIIIKGVKDDKGTLIINSIK